MANHLEQLISEWLEFTGYFVRRNVKVGKLSHGGHEGELDVVAYHPVENHLIHLEPSSDAHTWTKREQRFLKKFEVGRKYIMAEIFPWLPQNQKLEQWAIVAGSSDKHEYLAGGKVVPIRELYSIIAADVAAVGNGVSIPEHFPLLRTMQFTMRMLKTYRRISAEPRG